MKYLPLCIASVVLALSFVPVPPRPDGPVAEALRSATSSDRARVRGIYEALADVTERDAGKQISTLADWRSIHARTLVLAAGGTGLVGKYKGLDTAVDKVLTDAVGSLENVPLSQDVVSKLVAGCKEVVKQSE
jgi:hypothetical protein